jgi:sec-independent protein translocase protein TatA
MPNGWEWVILLVVVLLLFGAKRLPDMARSLGQSARVLKGEIKGMRDDDKRESSARPSARPDDPAPPPRELSSAKRSAQRDAEPARQPETDDTDRSG